MRPEDALVQLSLTREARVDYVRLRIFGALPFAPETAKAVSPRLDELLRTGLVLRRPDGLLERFDDAL